MFSALLPASETLRDASRFRNITSDKFRLADLGLLLGLGFVAAVATTLDWKLRLPGHAILRTVLPLALGLALVPRRGSGFLLSGSAGVGALGLLAAGWPGAGVGAVTSLMLAGPLLDLAGSLSRRGWHIYLSFAAAGLAANVAAFAVRWAAKTGGGGRAGSRLLAEWWPQAIGSYAVCGLVAGLIAAAICFRASSPRRVPTDEARS